MSLRRVWMLELTTSPPSVTFRRPNFPHTKPENGLLQPISPHKGKIITQARQRGELPRTAPVVRLMTSKWYMATNRRPTPIPSFSANEPQVQDRVRTVVGADTSPSMAWWSPTKRRVKLTPTRKHLSILHPLDN